MKSATGNGMETDLFICGTCKQQFNDVNLYMSHKEVCSIANGHAYMSNQGHLPTSHNPHCTTVNDLRTINAAPLPSAPVHHDHAYFHAYEQPEEASHTQPNTGLLMEMLSSLDSTSQMTDHAHSFTEQVMDDFIPPPPVSLSQASQQVSISPSQHAVPPPMTQNHHHLLQHPQQQHPQQQHPQQQHPQLQHHPQHLQAPQQHHQAHLQAPQHHQQHLPPQQHLQQQHPQQQLQQQHLQHQQQQHMQHQHHIQQQQQHIQQQQHQQQQQHIQHQHQLQQAQQLQQQQLHQATYHEHCHPLQQQPPPPPPPPQPGVYHGGVSVSGPPITSQSPPMPGGYLASVQRNDPVLMVNNGGVLTYVSQPVLPNGLMEPAHVYPPPSAPEMACASGPPARVSEPPSLPPKEEEAPIALPVPLEPEVRKKSAAGEETVQSRISTPHLQCQVCGRKFRRNFDLQMHNRTHTGEKPFQCIVCGRAFAQKCNVKRHMESHKVWPGSGGGGSGALPDIHTFEVRLDENRQLIVRPTKSIDHVMERREYRVLCPNGATNEPGPAAATNAAGSQVDESIVLVDNCWECRFCRSRFEDFQKLRSHMRQHSDQQVYLCVLSDCRDTFKQLDAFTEHLEEHRKRKEMVYVCHICYKTFPTLPQLGEHYNEHCRDNPREHIRLREDEETNKDGEKVPTYKCPECGMMFRRPASLQAHMVTNHRPSSDPPPTYVCSHCNKAFATEASLRHHIQMHSTVAQFQCSHCTKSFKTRQYLRIHERSVHEKSCPFTCPHCSRAFLSRATLRSHVISVHQPDQKAKCPLAGMTGCQFETAQPTAVATHLSSHAGLLKRPYPCARCGWRFSNPLLLKRHMRKHRSGERDGDARLLCELCGRHFLRRVPFDNHVIMCRQMATERERRQRRKRPQEITLAVPPPPPPPPPAVEEEEVAPPSSGRPARKRKFVRLWKPKGQKRRRRGKTEAAAVGKEDEEEEEEEDNEEEEAQEASGSSDLPGVGFEPLLGAGLMPGGGQSLPSIATFNQSLLKRELLDMSLVARQPNQNAPYTCSEDLKLLECADQFEAAAGAGLTGRGDGGVQF